MSIHAQARNRQEYTEQVLRLRLVGGGFAGFGEVEEQIYDEIERVDLGDEKAVAGAVARVRAIYDGVDWMPEPFRAVLDGKNHLPRTKLRPDLVGRRQGFMRSGAYRRHLFGDSSLAAVLAAFWREQVSYSGMGLRLGQRRHTAYARLHRA